MTILYGTRRQSFAVIAADSYGPGIDAEGRLIAEYRFQKIYTHPRLPLAAAASGMGSLRGQIATEHLSRLLGGLGMSSLDDRVPDRLVAYFEPLVREALQDTRWPSLGVRGMNILTAWAPRGVASMFLVRFGERTEVFRADETATLCYSDPLEIFYTTGDFAPGGRGFGNELTTTAELTAHARSVVSAGVVAEAELNLPRRTAGEPIDVIVVDREGTRLI